MKCNASCLLAPAAGAAKARANNSRRIRTQQNFYKCHILHAEIFFLEIS
jgi:hypothetical protein